MFAYRMAYVVSVPCPCALSIKLFLVGSVCFACNQHYVFVSSCILVEKTRQSLCVVVDRNIANFSVELYLGAVDVASVHRVAPIFALRSLFIHFSVEKGVIIAWRSTRRCNIPSTKSKSFGMLLQTSHWAAQAKPCSRLSTCQKIN